MNSYSIPMTHSANQMSHKSFIVYVSVPSFDGLIRPVYVKGSPMPKHSPMYNQSHSLIESS
jgi:hypothetical protein